MRAAEARAEIRARVEESAARVLQMKAKARVGMPAPEATLPSLLGTESSKALAATINGDPRRPARQSRARPSPTAESAARSLVYLHRRRATRAIARDDEPSSCGVTDTLSSTSRRPRRRPRPHSSTKPRARTEYESAWRCRNATWGFDVVRVLSLVITKMDRGGGGAGARHRRGAWRSAVSVLMLSFATPVAIQTGAGRQRRFRGTNRKWWFRFGRRGDGWSDRCGRQRRWRSAGRRVARPARVAAGWVGRPARAAAAAGGRTGSGGSGMGGAPGVGGQWDGRRDRHGRRGRRRTGGDATGDGAGMGGAGGGAGRVLRQLRVVRDRRCSRRRWTRLGGSAGDFRSSSTGRRRSRRTGRNSTTFRAFYASGAPGAPWSGATTVSAQVKVTAHGSSSPTTALVCVRYTAANDADTVWR